MLAPITVNTLSDVSDPNDGLTTLREAIAAAAANDTINFSVTGTINLTATAHVGQLLINKPLTIQGPGAGLLTITAFDPNPALREGNGERVFDITDSSNGATPPLVQISGVTLFGGDVGQFSPFDRDGGAIRSAGLLTLIEVTITGNSADRGGGVFVEVAGGGEVPRDALTVLTVIDCLIKDNDAFTGGGVAIVSGSPGSPTNDHVEVSGNTIFRNNRALSGSGGGLFAALQGASLEVSQVQFL